MVGRHNKMQQKIVVIRQLQRGDPRAGGLHIGINFDNERYCFVLSLRLA